MLDTPIDVAASMATFTSHAGFTQQHAGLNMWKSAADLDRYRHIIEADRPEVVVEAGTRWGGTAAWIADSFGVEVVTVDIAEPAFEAQCWPGVTFVLGSSVAPDIVDRVTKLVDGRRCMVILDSDHHGPHVEAEIRAYGPHVTPGCHLVVEDGLADLVNSKHARRFGRQIPAVGGPLVAIVRTLVGVEGWVRDLEVEALSRVSHSPGGWWRRV